MVQVTTTRLNGLYSTWARGAWPVLTTKIIYMHGYRITGLNWYQPATLRAASERNQMDAEVSGRMRHITQNGVSYIKRLILGFLSHIDTWGSSYVCIRRSWYFLSFRASHSYKLWWVSLFLHPFLGWTQPKLTSRHRPFKSAVSSFE